MDEAEGAKEPAGQLVHWRSEDAAVVAEAEPAGQGVQAIELSPPVVTE